MHVSCVDDRIVGQRPKFGPGDECADKVGRRQGQFAQRLAGQQDSPASNVRERSPFRRMDSWRIGYYWRHPLPRSPRQPTVLARRKDECQCAVSCSSERSSSAARRRVSPSPPQHHPIRALRIRRRRALQHRRRALQRLRRALQRLRRALQRLRRALQHLERARRQTALRRRASPPPSSTTQGTRLPASPFCPPKQPPSTRKEMIQKRVASTCASSCRSRV